MDGAYAQEQQDSRKKAELENSDKIPSSIHEGAEDTFGNAEQLQRHFDQTQSRLMKEKEELH